MNAVSLTGTGRTEEAAGRTSGVGRRDITPFSDVAGTPRKAASTASRNRRRLITARDDHLVYVILTL